jgi:hypothetical protein
VLACRPLGQLARWLGGGRASRNRPTEAKRSNQKIRRERPVARRPEPGDRERITLWIGIVQQQISRGD